VAAVTTKRLKGAPLQLIALVHVMTGTVMLAPLVDWTSFPQGAHTWAMLATLGIVHTGVMYALIYAAVQRLPTDLQGSLSFIYPVVAIFIDVVALGTTLQAIQIASVGAVIVAAAGATLGWGAQAGLRKPIQSR
jgi:drug/metabolite transporter (DMT)-like permease